MIKRFLLSSFLGLCVVSFGLYVYAANITYTVSDSNGSSIVVRKGYYLEESNDYATGGITIGNNGNSVSSSVYIQGENNYGAYITTSIVNKRNIQSSEIDVDPIWDNHYSFRSAYINAYANIPEQKTIMNAYGKTESLFVQANSTSISKNYDNPCKFSARAITTRNSSDVTITEDSCGNRR